MGGKEVAGAVFGTMIKIVAVALIVMWIYRFSIAAYHFGYRLFGEEPVTQGDGITMSVTVGGDDSVRDVGRMLEEKGLIRDANLFFVQELLGGSEKELLPGTYELNTSMTIEQMLEVLETDQEDAESADEAEDAGTAGGADETEGTDGAENAGAPDETEDTSGTEDTGETDGTEEPE